MKDLMGVEGTEAATGNIKNKVMISGIKSDLLQGWENTRKMSSAYTYVSQTPQAKCHSEE